MHEAHVSGLAVTVEGSGPTPVALLETDEQVIPVFIEPKQAKAIGMTLRGVPLERPLTHELTCTILGSVGATIERVRVDGFEDDTFFAKLDVHAAGEKHVFDARPSDALSLALREDATILVDDEVVEEVGRARRNVGAVPLDEMGEELFK